MSTTITRAWTDASMDNNTQIQNIDERTGESIQNVRERLLNGGHKVTVGSTDSKDGVHYTGSHNYGSSSWAVWNDGITTRNIEITNTQVILNASGGLSLAVGNLAVAAGNITASGTATFGGNTALTTASPKRLLVITGSGRANNSLANMYIEEPRALVPHGITGTIKKLYITCQNVSSSTNIFYKISAVYTGDPAAGTAESNTTSTTLLGYVSLANSRWGYTQVISNASVTGGEILWLDTNLAQSDYVMFHVVIELDW
jgi:hypothetical protein